MMTSTYPRVINNYKFDDYVDYINLIDLEIIEDTTMSASYPDLHIEIHSEDQLRMKLYDKRDYL
jgi:hypothetical protein